MKILLLILSLFSISCNAQEYWKNYLKTEALKDCRETLVVEKVGQGICMVACHIGGNGRPFVTFIANPFCRDEAGK